MNRNDITHSNLILFLIFALGLMLFMENPIVNEISYSDGNQVYMEFTQFWSKAQISKESPQPLWKTDVFHCALLSLLAISSILAVFSPPTQNTACAVFGVVDFIRFAT